MEELRINLLVFIGMIIATIYSGFVFSILWGWFFVSAFAVPAITIVEAIGISLIINGLISGSAINNDSDKYSGLSFSEIFKPLVFKSLFLSTYYLVIGWIVQFFI